MTDPRPPKVATTAGHRRVSYDVHGIVDGPPVLYLHGVPSSRLEVHVFGLPEAAVRARVRLVAIDRAGIGGTTPRPESTLAATADDVAVVADALGVRRFALLGYSAGSPFALATAHALADRVHALGIVSGSGPGEHSELSEGQADEVARMFRWARAHPRRLRAMLRLMRLGTRRPTALIRAAARDAPPADQAVLARPRAAATFAAFLTAAFQQGIDGVATDFRLAAGPWDVPLTALRMPVHLWHGEQDRNAPVSVARWLAAQLPTARLVTAPDDGHASLIATRGSEILTWLAEK